MSYPHSRPRDQHSVGEHSRQVTWTVTPSEGKDSDSSDSRKPFIILMFSLFCRCFQMFFPFLFLVLSSPLIQLSILLALRNLIKFLRFFFFSVTYFIVVINHWLYVGLLQFCGLFFLFFIIFIFNFLNLFLFFLHLFLCLLFLLFFSPCS